MSPYSPRSVVITTDYERATWNDVCPMDDCVSLESIEFDDFGDQDDNIAHNIKDRNFQRNLSCLQTQLARAEALNDHLNKEKIAQKREILELRQNLKSHKYIQMYEARLLRLKERLEFVEEERDHFIRQVRMLDDKVDELEKINEAQVCKLSVLEILYHARDRESEEGY